jgi:hypothetical protein
VAFVVAKVNGLERKGEEGGEGTEWKGEKGRGGGKRDAEEKAGE